MLRRPFLDAPPAVLRLPRTHAGLGDARQWLTTIPPHARTPKPALPPGSGAGAPLTDREREALEHLVAGLSTARIVAAMGTSTNTTRGHLRSILRKLSATNRADAVRRAAQQQLLQNVR